jgi:lysophospholipase L1-like esterase
VEQWFIPQGNGWVATVQPEIMGAAGFPAEPSAKRVAFLGGSSVHGGSMGVSTDGEFPALIGQLTGLECWNLAKPALDSHDLRTMTEELVAWRWDAVVVYTGHNDFGNTWFQERYGDSAGALSARVQSMGERTRTFGLLQKLVGGRMRIAETTGQPNESHPNVGQEQKQVALRYLGANLQRMAWLLHSHDIPMVLVTPVSALSWIPFERTCTSEPCAINLWQTGVQTRDSALLRQARDLDGVPLRPPTEAEELVRELGSSEAGVTLVDAERELPREEGMEIAAEWLFSDPVHFSAQGHRAMAQLLAPAVTKAVEGG